MQIHTRIQALYGDACFAYSTVKELCKRVDERRQVITRDQPISDSVDVSLGSVCSILHKLSYDKVCQKIKNACEWMEKLPALRDHDNVSADQNK